MTTALAYEHALPPGFPAPVIPADNPMSEAKVALGCRLFFEPRLSINGRLSCASCHTPELAFTDGRTHAIGAQGDRLLRGSMTLTNAAYNPALTWADATLTTLEAQVERPLFNEHPVELGLKPDASALLAALRQDSHYVAAFDAAFPGGDAVSMQHVIQAIATFERTLISGRAPFDRYIYDDERTALSSNAKQGMALFFSDRAGCVNCHSGLNFSGPIVHRTAKSVAAAFANNGLPTQADADPGLMKATRKAEDRGRFRVPTLRNIELTAPYMHDGRFATLEAVVDHYASGGVGGAIKPLDLTAVEKQMLVEFLRSLTDREFVTRDWARCRPQ